MGGGGWGGVGSLKAVKGRSRRGRGLSAVCQPVKTAAVELLQPAAVCDAQQGLVFFIISVGLLIPGDH